MFGAFYYREKVQQQQHNTLILLDYDSDSFFCVEELQNRIIGW